MKLIRWGAAGSEKPGLVDKDGVMRDLSGRIDDITPVMLSDDNLRHIAAIDAKGLPKLPASTIPIMLPKSVRPFPRNRLCS
jgi:hypothetical protein